MLPGPRDCLEEGQGQVSVEGLQGVLGTPRTPAAGRACSFYPQFHLRRGCGHPDSAPHFFSAKGSSGFACLVLVDFWFGLVLFRLFFIVVVILLCFFFLLWLAKRIERERGKEIFLRVLSTIVGRRAGGGRGRSSWT